MMTDTYGRSETWLRRWELVAGWPRCIDDAVPMNGPDADAVRNRNERIRAEVVAVEAYETAQRMVAQVEADDLPPATVTKSMAGGEAVEEANPRWTSYHNALTLVAEAGPVTLALALLRTTEKPPADSPDRSAYDAAIALCDAI